MLRIIYLYLKFIYINKYYIYIVERVALGQEEEAEPPQPFEWSPE